MTETHMPDSVPANSSTSQESLGGFVRLLAHELGNPLATIRMSAEMLAGGAPKELHEQLIEILLSESGRLESLIESAVYYTSMSHGEMQELDLHALLDAAIHNAETQVPTDLRIDADAPGVQGDPAQITRVVREVLYNAAEAGASHVDIHAQREGDYILLTVRDDGEGLSNVRISAIFEPFFTTREGQLGLGLSIARRILQHHDGSISLTAAEPQGTVVSIRLPFSVDGSNSH
jgi:signal transduction histidine kinase